MANCRMLHRGICTNEQLADCSLLARLLYTWGLPHTSDWGVLSASPRHLKAQVFPLGDETAAEVQVATDELCAAGLWIRFDNDGGTYVYYPTFDKYQDLHQRRTNTRDGMPLPPGYEGRYRKLPKATGSSGEFPEVPGSSRNSPEVPDSSGEFPRTKGMEVNGSEWNGTHAPAGTNDVAKAETPDLSQVDTCNNAVYSAAWHYWQGNGNPPKGRENWCRTLVVQAENAGIRQHLDDEAIVAALHTSPPLPSEWPDAWLGRLCRERLALARQDPAAATDPAIAECIRRHGPKPEDLFDLREWGEWLKGIRAEMATTAAGGAQ
jgi:hypothetical protein